MIVAKIVESQLAMSILRASHGKFITVYFIRDRFPAI